jgi:hypothetical protein
VPGVGVLSEMPVALAVRLGRRAHKLGELPATTEVNGGMTQADAGAAADAAGRRGRWRSGGGRYDAPAPRNNTQSLCTDAQSYRIA